MDRVKEYIELSNQYNDIKGKMEKLKAEFLQEAEGFLDNQKNKSVSFSGDGGKIRVTLSQEVKVQIPSALKKLLGEKGKDYLKEKTEISTSSEASRMIIALYQGSYVDESFDSVLKEMNISDKSAALIKRKFKGINFLADTELLKNQCGMSEDDAKSWAYFLTEAIMGEKINAFLKLVDVTKEEAVNIVKASCDINEKTAFSLETF